MRIASIDILRALTMLLMIWVNDFWTLVDVPKWLRHAEGSEDYLGFSDIIFPLFLFIVGLSIPFAIKNRLDKGDSKKSIAVHILIRSLSLMLIGVFTVNWETSYTYIEPGGNQLWGLLMATAVSLIWMNWKRSPVDKKWHLALQLFGWAILIYLALIYQGGPNGEFGMRIQWWGILGLIGWAYAYNALIFLFSKGNMWIMIGSWLLMSSLAIMGFTDFAIHPEGFISNFSTIYSGTIPAFTAAGIVATLITQKLAGAKNNLSLIVLIVIGLACVSFGLLTRPIWGISKIQGTPSWLTICMGIGFLSFVALFYVADIKQKVNWARIIGPAGTATLTCYMIPYFVYSIRNFTGLRLPDFVNFSVIGLIGSFLFAIAVVVFTGIMENKGFKLKL